MAWVTTTVKMHENEDNMSRITKGQKFDEKIADFLEPSAWNR